MRSAMRWVGASAIVLVAIPTVIVLVVLGVLGGPYRTTALVSGGVFAVCAALRLGLGKERSSRAPVVLTFAVGVIGTVAGGRRPHGLRRLERQLEVVDDYDRALIGHEVSTERTAAFPTSARRNRRDHEHREDTERPWSLLAAGRLGAAGYGRPAVRSGVPDV